MIVFSVYGVSGPVSALVTPGNASQTAADIAVAELLFRSGIASLIAVVVLDVVVAGALFDVFASVNRSASAVAAWFRVAYAAVFLVAITQLLEAPARDGEQLLQSLSAFNNIWDAGLILFSFHLLLIGWLACRSGFMPRVFGVLLVIAGLGYLTDGFGAMLIPGYSLTIAQFAFVGEVALIFWLLIKGRRIKASEGAAARQPEALAASV